MTEQDKRELDRHFAWFEGKLPPKPARFVTWLRKPSSRLARIPLAILLIVGGFFSFFRCWGSGCSLSDFFWLRRTCQLYRVQCRGCSDGSSANGRSGSRVVQASCEQAIKDSPSWQPALCSNESPA